MFSSAIHKIMMFSDLKVKSKVAQAKMFFNCFHNIIQQITVHKTDLKLNQNLEYIRDGKVRLKTVFLIIRLKTFQHYFANDARLINNNYIFRKIEHEIWYRSSFSSNCALRIMQDINSF